MVSPPAPRRAAPSSATRAGGQVSRREHTIDAAYAFRMEDRIGSPHARKAG
ncbi:hypothetical protein IMZ11_30320 [Microtetraspora sp. AC03309]|uniref:hypothetical protein n=1 Tax=Microtetraspora sp. AC03309 TaxID=2779376 RepID=UPI001E2BCD69|nr:hypothetical protein [Microtetraspora sp. AC03309]MCC5579927.1 hypothetical protein [Microtetraspora sp. AC03309]